MSYYAIDNMVRVLDWLDDEREWPGDYVLLWPSGYEGFVAHWDESDKTVDSHSLGLCATEAEAVRRIRDWRVIDHPRGPRQVH